MTETTSDATRSRTAIDTIADAHLDAELALDPIAATSIGAPGFETELTDYSPSANAERSALRRKTLAALDDAEPVDDVDRVTTAALRERLSVEEELYAAGTDESSLNVIASPVQSLRSVYDLMAKKTADDWATVATRLRKTPAAMDAYVESLRTALQRGDVSARRQVERCVDQARGFAAADGFFAELASGARLGDAPEGADELPGALQRDLNEAAGVAASAFRRLADVLTDELLPAAPVPDGVGRDRYALWSRYFLGARIDLDETYAWGLDELERIETEMRQIADRIKPGASIAEAIDVLDADPERRLEGTDALRAWMQQKSDAAVEALSQSHFDIPQPIRRLECCIAPTHEGGIYYTGPSEDFSRPGRMWWSVPKDVTWFGTWRETTTVYHEGVPGHHLQVGQTVYRSELLNRWRRMGCWVSGHGEGWALYAERLMADLGFLDDPADRFGMLDAQAMRAARVALDIGVHLGLEAPAQLGGGTWDADKAWTFLTSHVNMAEGFLRFELDRYLGWPGQAPAYKVGERLWLSIRDELRQRQGDAFDLTAFHRRALDIGSVGLDVLRDTLLR
ncbi:MAG TPA: DUF885 domain-containing protein [Actinomycetales bacterium]|nr:DUF885 domain-containing protein [Actinomycetales bacterium]